jgi:hypothetical protein
MPYPRGIKRGDNDFDDDLGCCRSGPSADKDGDRQRPLIGQLEALVRTKRLCAPWFSMETDHLQPGRGARAQQASWQDCVRASRCLAPEQDETRLDLPAFCAANATRLWSQDVEKPPLNRWP